jgi:hypothetical protein
MQVKNKSAARTARRKLKAQDKSDKTVKSNYSPIKNLNMGKTNISGSSTKNPKDIRVGISFFMSHPTAGHQVIDFATDLERFTMIYNHVNQSPEYSYSSLYHSHMKLMELYVSDAPIGEDLFTIAMHYLVAFGSVGVALKSGKFKDYGFMIAPTHDDFNDAIVGTLDYDSWNFGRETRNAA